jgi:co-chaperonin GroES (HSP10)
MKFIPFADKIVVEPLEKKGVIVTGQEDFLEDGKVVDFGKDVDFVKKGDIIHFLSYGCSNFKFENKTYYIVSANNGVILGKHEK